VLGKLLFGSVIIILRFNIGFTLFRKIFVNFEGGKVAFGSFGSQVVELRTVLEDTPTEIHTADLYDSKIKCYFMSLIVEKSVKL